MAMATAALIVKRNFKEVDAFMALPPPDSNSPDVSKAVVLSHGIWTLSSASREEQLGSHLLD